MTHFYMLMRARNLEKRAIYTNELCFSVRRTSAAIARRMVARCEPLCFLHEPL